MSVSKEEFDKEKKYLGKVIEVFDQKYIEQIENFSSIAKRADELKQYLQDNKHNMDPGEISQTIQTISQMVDSGNRVNQKHSMLKRVHNAPYFGRFDFEDNTHKDFLKIYVGLTSIYEDGKEHYLVYDWRSPISSLYYEDGLGKFSYLAPVGKIEGDIVLKRQYKIENRQLEFVFDNSININDELLKDALMKNTSAKMKNIVNSIQQEQNQVIRNLGAEVVIVDGPAGSGKTSVALHRIAYLLYRDSEYLNADNVVVLSPSSVFSEYISRVLPELGEENIKYITFGETCLENLDGRFVVQTFNNFIKGVYETKSQVERDANKLMSSGAFKHLIDEYVKNLEAVTEFRDIYYLDKLAISKTEYEQYFKHQYSHFKLQPRVEHLITKATLNVYENLSREERVHIKKPKVKANISKQMRQNLKVEHQYKKMLQNTSAFEKHIKKLALKTPAKKLIGFMLERLGAKTLHYDDLIALAYLRLKLSGLKPDNTIKHLIIDEAQDYTLMQYEIIRAIFQDTEFTIVGDVNQSINPNLKYSDFESLHEVFAKKKIKHFSLLNCYRNSFEISNFSNALIEERNVKAMNRHSELPSIYHNHAQEQMIDQIATQVRQMQKAGFKQIGIITKMADSATHLYENLKDKIEQLRHIDYESEQYTDGVCVLSSYVSKGLEFDGVISVNFKKDYKQQNEKHLLYVVFTRALHKLVIINEDDDMGLLGAIPSDLYQIKN